MLVGTTVSHKGWLNGGRKMIPNETRQMKMWITDIEYNGLFGSLTIWKTKGKKEYLIIHSSRDDLFNEEGHNILARFNKPYEEVIRYMLSTMITHIRRKDKF